MTRRIRAWAQHRLVGITGFYAFDSTNEARKRILDAVVKFFDVDRTDDIEMTQWQELTDAIMKSLFRR